VHVPRRLEGRNSLFVYRDGSAGARVAPGACPARLDPEHAKVAQLDPVALLQGGGDGVQDRVDDLLRVPLVQVRVPLSDPSIAGSDRARSSRALIRALPDML
jgi:hypothetical protein